MNMEDQRMLQQNGIEFVNNFQQNELSLNDFNENQQVQYSTENVYDTANVGNVDNTRLLTTVNNLNGAGTEWNQESKLSSELVSQQQTTQQLSETELNKYSYKINYDPNPKIIKRNNNESVEYKQEVAIRYLQPPTPPPPGPIIIKEIRPPMPPAAPPVVIRQRPPRPATPPPMVVRENPPQPPIPPAPKIITKQLPQPLPPPRRVIIERLPALPEKPRSLIIERWLPYKSQKRRVVYQRANAVKAHEKLKNLIIQWSGPKAKVIKEVRNLGIIKVNPSSYLQKYSGKLQNVRAIETALTDYGLNINSKQLAPSGAAGGESGLYSTNQTEDVDTKFDLNYSENGENFDYQQLTEQNEESHQSSQSVNQSSYEENFESFQSSVQDWKSVTEGGQTVVTGSNLNNEFEENFDAAGFSSFNEEAKVADTTEATDNWSDEIKEIIRRYQVPGYKTFQVTEINNSNEI
ncbi:hypothetical protein SNEBB_006979 [Seison nebaliae]|nr:hypothetical protein SNEBB_006979 [Seison nebaliae]